MKKQKGKREKGKDEKERKREREQQKGGKGRIGTSSEGARKRKAWRRGESERRGEGIKFPKVTARGYIYFSLSKNGNKRKARGIKPHKAPA